MLPAMVKHLVLLFLLFSCMFFVAKAMWIHHENSSFGEPVFVRTPRMTFMGPSVLPEGGYEANPVEGQLLYTDERHPSMNLTGVVLIYRLGNGQMQEDAAAILRDSGLSALIVISRARLVVPGAGNWVRSGRIPNQPFPVFEITARQNKSLDGWFRNSTIVRVSIGEDHNPWDLTFKQVMPPISSIILVFSGVVAIISAYRLTLTVATQGFRLTIAQVIFWLNLIGACIRIAWGASDPFGCYGTTNFVWTEVSLSLSFPMGISGCLLIALYWHEMIKRNGSKINLFLDRMLLPFVIFAILFAIFDLGTALARGYQLSFAVMIFLDGAVYCIVIFTILIFFIVTRCRLQKVFDQINKGLNQTNKGRKLSLATTRIALLLATLVLWLIDLMIIGAFDVVWHPVSYIVLWTICFFTFNTICLLQVLVVRAPKRTWKWILCGPFVSDPSIYLSTETLSESSQFKSSSAV